MEGIEKCGQAIILPEMQKVGDRIYLKSPSDLGIDDEVLTNIGNWVDDILDKSKLPYSEFAWQRFNTLPEETKQVRDKVEKILKWLSIDADKRLDAWLHLLKHHHMSFYDLPALITPRIIPIDRNRMQDQAIIKFIALLGSCMYVFDDYAPHSEKTIYKGRALISYPRLRGFNKTIIGQEITIPSAYKKAQDFLEASLGVYNADDQKTFEVHYSGDAMASSISCVKEITPVIYAKISIAEILNILTACKHKLSFIKPDVGFLLRQEPADVLSDHDKWPVFIIPYSSVARLVSCTQKVVIKK